MDTCIHSPFYGHPTIHGAAQITGNVRLCDLIDPTNPSYHPRADALYREMTAGLNGIPPEVCGVLTTRYDPVGPPIFIPHPIPGRPVPPPRPIPAHPEHPRNPKAVDPRLTAPFAPIEDEATHAMVFEAARTCPHRIESKSCCSGDKCGPDGENPGLQVGIGVCYPCSIGRLGLTRGPGI